MSCLLPSETLPTYRTGGVRAKKTHTSTKKSVTSTVAPTVLRRRVAGFPHQPNLATARRNWAGCDVVQVRLYKADKRRWLLPGDATHRVWFDPTRAITSCCKYGQRRS
jgi:hypothetical protein